MQHIVCECINILFLNGMIERYDKGDHTLVIDRTGPRPIVYREYKKRPAKKPGMVRKVRNFTRAAVNHARAGRPKATAEQVAERFAICEQCEYLNREKMQCGKCGCGVKKIVGRFSKLSWADSKCPDGRWHAVNSDVVKSS